ncbi:MBL fold metallo-hydrolase [Salinibius halmophilus]|uniref:MBL fold metallo-hydrolase n=1 Tax=Salinibius halmophilus TaxID=1853216 RepID=UPI0018F68EE3|nr:MBL fold metallo-hydrolase [Salinibius halmophilus]
MAINILHHGAASGVTGSCHELQLSTGRSLLIDCGLFQGSEARSTPEIEFDVSTIDALLVTHCHIDHVGRIPYLLAAGFNGPIFATHATAKLLPLVIRDALKVGATDNERLIEQVIDRLQDRLIGLEYNEWFMPTNNARARFRMAGHILGSAYIEIDTDYQRVVFSGDLGAPHTPLLPAPSPLEYADILVLESTYGDKNHSDRVGRTARLKRSIERAFKDNGTILIPAFSIGRTQELLYELEEILHSSEQWEYLDIIVDSPLAAKFTDQYRALSSLWDQEAKQRVKSGRHPLSFDQLLTINSHDEHLKTIEYLKKTGRAAIVIAASGMCTGGRIVNYLKALLPDPRTDVLFVGYQAQGTPGRDIQHYGTGGWVKLEGKKINIAAQVTTISGYSAHAGQDDLIGFACNTSIPVGHIRLVHGDLSAKEALAKQLSTKLPDSIIEVIVEQTVWRPVQ